MRSRRSHSPRTPRHPCRDRQKWLRCQGWLPGRTMAVHRANPHQAEVWVRGARRLARRPFASPRVTLPVSSSNSRDPRPATPVHRPRLIGFRTVARAASLPAPTRANISEKSFSGHDRSTLRSALLHAAIIISVSDYQGQNRASIEKWISCSPVGWISVSRDNRTSRDGQAQVLERQRLYSHRTAATHSASSQMTVIPPPRLGRGWFIGISV